MADVWCLCLCLCVCACLSLSVFVFTTCWLYNVDLGSALAHLTSDVRAVYACLCVCVNVFPDPAIMAHHVDWQSRELARELESNREWASRCVPRAVWEGISIVWVCHVPHVDIMRLCALYL